MWSRSRSPGSSAAPKEKLKPTGRPVHAPHSPELAAQHSLRRRTAGLLLSAGPASRGHSKKQISLEGLLRSDKPSQGTDRQTDRPSPNKHACCVTSCDAATLPTGKPESEYNQTRLRRTAAELGGPPVKQPSPVMKIAGHTSQQRQGFGKHQARAFSSGFSSAKKHRRQVEKQHGHLVATCTGHLSSVGGAAPSSKRLPCSLDTPTIVHPAMQECK